MALTILSPWPTTTAAVHLADAIACIKAEIGADLTDDRANALGATASALVESYAPSAPQAVKNESTIRTAGYLTEHPSAAVRQDTVGDVTVGYAAGNVSALRHSGAMSLLSPWKKRRAGAIG